MSIGMKAMLVALLSVFAVGSMTQSATAYDWTVSGLYQRRFGRLRSGKANSRVVIKFEVV